MSVDKKPPREDRVLARPKMVPEKLGAMSSPLLKYPPVTAPLTVKANVKITMENTRSYPKKTWRSISSPGPDTAEKNHAVIIFVYTFI